jgi:hypothetical protein
MEPLDLEELPDRALLLIDSAPIIYVLEGHAKFGPRFKPLFQAHAAGRLRFAVTTLTIAEVLTGPLQAAPSLKHGSRLRSTWILRKAPRDCGLRSASSSRTPFKPPVRWRSAPPPW